MDDDAQRAMGMAAVAAGLLFFLGQGGELVFGDDSRVTSTAVVGLMAGAVASFGVAFWFMRKALAGSRLGRAGADVGLVGFGFLVAFSVQLASSMVVTGEVPENFILFAVGFLLIFVAHLLVARPLRRVLGNLWWLSVLAPVALIVALATNEIFIWHDLALFVFEGCWVAIGLVALRRAAVPAHQPLGPSLPAG